MGKEKKKPKGIKGFLILVIIGLVIGSIGYLYATIDIVSRLSEYPQSIFLIILVMTLLFTYTLFITLKKKKNAPIFNIVLLWANLLTAFVLFLIRSTYEQIDKADVRFDILKFFLIAMVWTLYFVFSKRVKNTFVN